jgi:hypothetical protein
MQQDPSQLCSCNLARPWTGKFLSFEVLEVDDVSPFSFLYPSCLGTGSALAKNCKKTSNEGRRCVRKNGARYFLLDLPQD